CLAHVVERELNRWAVVVAEGLEDRRAHFAPSGFEGDVAVAVRPPRGDDRRQDSVRRLRKRRVLIAQEPLPSRSGGLQHQQVVDSGLDLWLAAVACHGRDAVATAPALEGVLVGTPADLE